MVRVTSKFVCQQCGYESLRWLGRCPNCDSWNSLVETLVASGKTTRGKTGEKVIPQSLAEIKIVSTQRLSTGIGEFDRVLGGGIVAGSVALLAGDPGIGKSTLLLQVASRLASSAVFYISGEESPGQIKIRAERIGIKAREAQNLFFLNETNVDAIIETLTEAAGSDYSVHDPDGERQLPDNRAFTKEKDREGERHLGFRGQSTVEEI